jgi:hypothetical protein
LGSRIKSVFFKLIPIGEIVIPTWETGDIGEFSVLSPDGGKTFVGFGERAAQFYDM